MGRSTFLSGRAGLALAWGLVLLAAVVFLGLALPRAEVSSDVMELLPDSRSQAADRRILKALSDRMGRELVFAVSGPEAAAEGFEQALRGIPGIASVTGRLDPVRAKASEAFLFEHRAAFLSEASRRRLKEGENEQAAWVLSQLFSPVSGVSSAEISADPLLLMRGSALAEAGSGWSLQLVDGWPSGTDASGRRYRILQASAGEAAASPGCVSELVASIQGAEREIEQAFPGTRIVAQGALFYSDYAASSAKRDMTVLGGISALALLAILAAAFRSALPLFLCLASIGAGAVVGAAATLLAFGKIHMVTLVMSLSLIGVSADYTTHFFTARLDASEGEDAPRTLLRLRPSLVQALATTCAAYAALLFAPFPGLRQLGVFSVAGLAAAFVTVLLWHPLAAERVRPRPLAFGRWLAAYAGLWARSRLFPALVIGAIAAFAAAGLWRAQIEDDLSALQAPPAELRAQEAAIREVTGRDASQRWLLATGKTLEAALEVKDALAPGLEDLGAQGMITGAALFPMNSLKTQSVDQALIERAKPGVAKVLSAYGVSVSPRAARLQPLSFGAFASDTLGGVWRRLVLESPEGCAILIPVQGERSAAASARLEALAESVPGALWIDRRADFSSLFGEARHSVGLSLAAALLLIAGFYAWRFGARRMAGVLVPCVLALGSGLAALGWLSLSVNIFSLFALVLILGIGIDYAIFFSAAAGGRIGAGRSEATLFAVTVAMLTTVASLGILAFSGTAAVANFGITLTAGVLAAFLASPLSLALQNRNEVRKCSG